MNIDVARVCTHPKMQYLQRTLYSSRQSHSKKDSDGRKTHQEKAQELNFQKNANSMISSTLFEVSTSFKPQVPRGATADILFVGPCQGSFVRGGSRD